MLALPRFLAVMVSLMLALRTLATDRYFPDITKSSDNARYRLDAKSPDNQKPQGPQRAFARHFTYTLTDTNEQRTLWTYHQKNEASPVGAWVHDTGWVVVRTGWDELIAFDPKDGVVTGKVHILEQFPENERAKYVHQTTAGPAWAQSSRWSFLELNGKLCFVVRAHWGRRIIMELATGKVISDKGDAESITSKQDKEWVLATLKTNVPLLDGPHDSDLVRATCAAIDIAARDQVREAIPMLREAEKSEYVGSSGGVPIFIGDNNLPDGALDPFWYSVYTVRHKAQTALRKLGEIPSERPAIGFHPRGKYGDNNLIRPDPKEPRAAALPKIKPGQTPMEVLQAAGGPDGIARPGRDIAWEYHVDGKNARSVRVFWSQKAPPAVTKVEDLTPPTWKGEEDLD